MRKNRAFTLLELVFVVTIIALLLAIMLPMLSMSKDKARKANCVANLNQLGVVTKLYVDEQGYYPDTLRRTPEGIFYWFGLDDGSSIKFDRGPMHDYIKNQGILICPAFAAKHKSLDPTRESVCSYGINAEYVGGDPEVDADPTETDILDSNPAKSLYIRQADKTMMFMDSAYMDSGELSESAYFWARYSFVSGAQHEARSHFRHRKVAVGVFCDGHTEDNILPYAIDNEPFRIGWPAQGLCERH